MQPLSTLDTLFITLDSKELPLHGGGTLVLDPSTASEPITFDRVREHLRRLLPVMPPLRRRLVKVPMGLDVPIWIEDEHFDLDNHLNHIACPAPGTDRQLADLTGRITTPAMDFSRPLWDCTFVEGLEGGRVALILRMHHACVDGMGGVEMLMQMFSTDPSKDMMVELPEDTWEPDRVPTDAQMLLHAAPKTVLRPYKTAKTVTKMAMGMLRGRDEAGAVEGGEPGGRIFAGPKLPWNDTPAHLNRTIAWVDVPMADVKTIRTAFDAEAVPGTSGAKVNDVVLALVGGAVRRYLQARGALPDEPLVIANPVNVRTKDDTGKFENTVNIMTVKLPTHIADPVARLERTIANATASKVKTKASGTNMFEDLFDVMAPGLAELVAHNVAANPFVAERMPPAFNAGVTNLMGPQFPLYFLGAKLEGFRIQMMQAFNIGLVVALISYNGDLHMSITGSRELVPDIWSLADGIEQERQTLLKVAEERLSERPSGPAATAAP